MKTNQLPKHHPRTQTAAFTLIELLLVLVILGILAAIVVPKFSGRTLQAQIKAAQSQVTAFGTALDTFEIDTGHYPKSLQELIARPGDVQVWNGPYLKTDAVPKDPWGNDYIYNVGGPHMGERGYDLMSAGPNGRVGDDDDICNWTLKK
jgi:general secretion pathway protein G